MQSRRNTTFLLQISSLFFLSIYVIMYPQREKIDKTSYNC